MKESFVNWKLDRLSQKQNLRLFDDIQKYHNRHRRYCDLQ